MVKFILNKKVVITTISVLLALSLLSGCNLFDATPRTSLVIDVTWEDTPVEMSNGVRVQIEGEGQFWREVEAPTVIHDIPPGIYKIIALDYVDNDGVYIPQPRQKMAQVKENDKTNVNLTYKRIYSGDTQIFSFFKKKDEIKSIKTLSCKACENDSCDTSSKLYTLNIQPKGPEYLALSNDDSDNVVYFVVQRGSMSVKDFDKFMSDVQENSVLFIENCESDPDLTDLPQILKVLYVKRNAETYPNNPGIVVGRSNVGALSTSDVVYYDLLVKPTSLDEVAKEYKLPTGKQAEVSDAVTITLDDLFAGAIEKDPVTQSYNFTEIASLFLGDEQYKIRPLSQDTILNDADLMLRLPMALPESYKQKQFAKYTKVLSAPIVDTDQDRKPEICKSNKAKTLKLCLGLEKIGIQTYADAAINRDGKSKKSNFGIRPTGEITASVKWTRFKKDSDFNLSLLKSKVVIAKGIIVVPTPSGVPVPVPYYVSSKLEIGLFGKYSIQSDVRSVDRLRNKINGVINKKHAITLFKIKYDLGELFQDYMEIRSIRNKPPKLDDARSPVINTRLDPLNPKYFSASILDIIDFTADSWSQPLITVNINPYIKGSILVYGLLGGYVKGESNLHTKIDLFCKSDTVISVDPSITASGGFEADLSPPDKLKKFFAYIPPLFKSWLRDYEFKILSHTWKFDTWGYKKPQYKLEPYSVIAGNTNGITIAPGKRTKVKLSISPKVCEQKTHTVRLKSNKFSIAPSEFIPANGPVYLKSEPLMRSGEYSVPADIQNKDSNYKTTSQVDIYVEDVAPEIEYFTVEPNEVQITGQLTLNWKAFDDNGDEIYCSIKVKNLSTRREKQLLFVDGAKIDSKQYSCVKGTMPFSPSLGEGRYVFIFEVWDEGHPPNKHKPHKSLEFTRVISNDNNRPPSVHFFKASIQKGVAPLLVGFTAFAEDPDGDTLHCTLDYGDHSPLHKACLDDEKPTRHIYKNPGVYRAVYTVSDGEFEVSKPVVIVVQKKEEQETNTAPTVQFDANPKQGPAPLTVTFTMSQNDEDGDALTCTLDLGDGSKVTGCLSRYPHTYTKAGTYHAVYRVSDGKVTVPKSVTIVVEDQDQGGSDGGSGDGGSGDEGDSNNNNVNNNAKIRYFRAHPSPASEKDTITLEWSAYDPEGDPLVCSIFVSYKNSQGQWVHRDQLVKRYADADAAKCAQGTLSYKPAWGVGTYIFGLNVRDVNHENEPPAYQPVTVEVKNFNAEVLSFSLNPTTLHEGEAFTYSWTLKDYEGDSIVCRLEMGRMGSTERGTTIYYAKACPWKFSNTYVPKQGPGKYWVSLTIHDTKHTDPVHPNPPSTVIEILPSESENKPPVIDLFTVDPPEVEENESVRFSWQAHDPDGDPLVCGLGVKNVTNGRTEVLFSNSTSRCTQGSWPYTPSLGVGDYKAVLVVKEKGASNDDAVHETLSFRVKKTKPVNHKPTAKLTALPNSGTAPLTVRFRTEESDPDGDSLTCTLTPGDGSTPYRGCGDFNHTYTKPGTYRAVYEVTDGKDRAVARVTVTVSAANHPPVIDRFSVTPTSITEGESLRFQWRSHDPDHDDLVCGLGIKNLNNGRTKTVFSASGTTCTNGSRTYRPTLGEGRYVAVFVVKERGASNDDAVKEKVYFEVKRNENAKIDSFSVFTRQVNGTSYIYVHWKISDPEGDPIVCRVTVWKDTGQSDNSAYYSTNCPNNKYLKYVPKWGPGTYHVSFTIHDNKHTDPVQPNPPSVSVIVR